MIVRFPDRDFPYITVLFDTNTYQAEYEYDDGQTKPCSLSLNAWRVRLRSWGIDLPALIEQTEYYVDEGL